MRSIRLDEIRIPDSALAGDAFALATAALPAALVARIPRAWFASVSVASSFASAERHMR
jgi:hypothetical protein